MKKRMAVTTLLALSLMFALAVTALAAEGDFQVRNGVLVRYSGPGGEAIVPEDVTEIGGGAFADCDGLTAVTIPEGVTAIGDDAFSGCGGLKDVYFTGSAADWRAVRIGSGNDRLAIATIHPDAAPPAEYTAALSGSKGMGWIVGGAAFAVLALAGVFIWKLNGRREPRRSSGSQTETMRAFMQIRPGAAEKWNGGKPQ